MIAAWMAYAFVIAALVSCAALIAERIALLRRLQSRWIWVAALVLSLALPIMVAWNGELPSDRPTRALLALTAHEEPAMYEQSPIAWISGNSQVVARRMPLDAWLLAAWAGMSVVALAVLSIGWLQLRRRLRAAVDGQVDGVSVTVTRDIGPAVIGMMRPRIVIPGWLLQQDSATQSIALAHEQEHLRAQDIRVLGSALLIAMLLPWNLPMWWQLRRLSVATHLVPLRAAAARLSESGSSLERRIRIMHTPLRARWRLLAAFLGTCSVALIAVAANVTAPPVPAIAGDYDGGLPLLPTPVADWRDDDAQLFRSVGHFYPELLTTQQDGRPYVWAVVNERGEVSQIDLTLRPSWDSEDDFARNWQEYQQRAGIVAGRAREQRVVQAWIGPNFAVVAWVMQPGAPAQDPAAPTLSVAPGKAQTMQDRMLATAEAQRRVIEHFDPGALSEGVPAGQELWFLIDPNGKALRSGRRAVITDPQAARLAMKQMLPKLSVGYVTRGTVVKDTSGRRVPVSWQWLEQ
jgi:BlaR1 peptidase M56